METALGIIVIACVTVAATGFIFRVIRGMELLERLNNQAELTSQILERLSSRVDK
jgi:hypothetical protein